MILQNKLQSSIENGSVSYYHPFSPEIILNTYVGRTLSISASPQRTCIGCQKSVKKIVGGYCYMCSRRLACCDMCILKPHLCHYHLGTCREPSWGEKHCFSDHVLYLSLTSGFKVGLTRKSQYLTRWVDQGASQAAILVSLKNRRMAGVLEDYLSRSINDRTNWRHLLTGKLESSEDFTAHFNRLQALIREQDVVGQKELTIEPLDIQYINYPVNSYLEKAKSINLDKTPFFEDKLLGIKGQYMLFECAGGLNMRKYQGYDLTLELVES